VATARQDLHVVICDIESKKVSEFKLFHFHFLCCLSSWISYCSSLPLLWWKTNRLL